MKSSSTRKCKRRLAAFDTEDDSKGNVIQFCVVWDRGSYVTKDRNDFLIHLCSLGKLELWATNLEYDLVNLFGVERLGEVNLRYSRSALCSASWKDIAFRDTLRHLPASVEELGKLVGLEKLLFAPDSPEYVRRDATITYRAAKLIHKSYRVWREEPRSTLPATAFRVWESHYWGKELKRPLNSVRELATHAYFGGRTEPFAIGRFRNVHVIDASSMFPWAMTAGPFPVPWKVRRTRELVPNGIFRVRVETERPCLPFRTDRGLVYPIGSWETAYVGEELLASGARIIKVLDGWRFDEFCRPFDGYVRALFQKKQRARGPERSMYKLLLNGLYGKFGQEGERVRIMPLERYRALTRPVLARVHVWQGLALWLEPERPPYWSNKVWAAWVTARARMKLGGEIERVRQAGGRVLYCDTDSIFYKGADGLSYPIKAKRPGEFEYRGIHSTLHIVGKKEYTLWANGVAIHHAKGIPLKMRGVFLHTGRASFERPVRLRESIRLGLIPNVWRRVEKERKTVYLGGGKEPDGSLLPLRISQ